MRCFSKNIPRDRTTQTHTKAQTYASGWAFIVKIMFRCSNIHVYTHRPYSEKTIQKRDSYKQFINVCKLKAKESSHWLLRQKQCLIIYLLIVLKTLTYPLQNSINYYLLYHVDETIYKKNMDGWMDQRYLTAIHTYFGMRWLIRSNSYDITRSILHDLSKPQRRYV